MKLKLTRPICGIDVETTGLDKTVDRIIEITITKIEVDGTIVSKTRRINPGTTPIQEGAFEKHRISEEDLKDEPTFSQLAKGIYRLIKDCDFIMYNGLAFDVSFLDEEFLRCGMSIDWEFQIVDPYKIFTKEEPRTLYAAYKYYCNKESDKMHSAEEDVKVMLEVLDSQIEKYEYEPTVEAVAVKRNCIDFDGKIKLTEDGKYVWNFGKYKDCEIIKDLGYCEWVLNGNFTRNTKNHLIKLLIAAGLYDQIKQN